MTSLTKEMQVKFVFCTRNMLRKKIELTALLERVSTGCNKIRNGEKFPDLDSAMTFLREYALVRDIAAVSEFAEHLRQYGITSEHLKKCTEIVEIIEKPVIAPKMKANLFEEMRLAPFDRQKLEIIFNHFVIANLPANTKR